MLKINKFFYGLTGIVITPKNHFYEEARQEWNRAIQKFPIAIVFCSNKCDVSNAILWARKNCVSFRIRNGRHNYEGYSTGNGVMVIDISKMNSISICNGFVKAEGGANNAQIYDYVSSYGYPFPGGTCPTVGLSGLISGGGWGLSCRMFGLACDSLVEVEIIDYNGQTVTASEVCNRELFWAIRGGGGGNFGVIVSMTFRLPPKVEMVTYINIYYPDTDVNKQVEFFETYQNWIIDADRRITLISRMYHSQEEDFAINVRGIFYGMPEEAEEILKPFINLGGGILTLEYITFFDAISKIGSAYPDSEMFKDTGRFALCPLSYNEIFKLVEMMRDFPPGSKFSALSLYSLGGKVMDVSSYETAFFYRDAQYIIGIQSVWTDERFAETNINWIDERFKYLEKITNGSYVNFPYRGLVDYMHAYYGKNADKLRDAKYRYDPLNIFCFPQSIN